MPMKLETMEKKFWERVYKLHDGCWEWTGKRNNWGYGIVHRFKREYVVSRISYEQFHGPIPGNLCVLHHCDNRICVRPDHLFLGTRKDNCLDKIAKGRENYKPPKLNEAIVLAIRDRYKAGETQTMIAWDYGISSSMVSRICSRHHWKNVA